MGHFHEKLHRISIVKLITQDHIDFFYNKTMKFIHPNYGLCSLQSLTRQQSVCLTAPWPPARCSPVSQVDVYPCVAPHVLPVH